MSFTIGEDGGLRCLQCSPSMQDEVKSPPTWTRERPEPPILTEFWWVRYANGLRWVLMVEPDGGTTDHNGECTHLDEFPKSCEWSGPIQEPE